jgi:LEA14-like dessication related protein
MLPRPFARASLPRPARRPAAARLPLLLAAAGLAASGCQAAVDRAFQRPTVAFHGAAVRAVGPEGGVMDVRLLVRNPNPYPLDAERATYRLLAADSSELGRGEATDSLRVPARDSAVVRLPVAVSWAALARAGAGALGAAAAGGAVEYRVVGEVRVRTPVGAFPVPVDVPGRATLRVPGGLGGALGGLLGR